MDPLLLEYLDGQKWLVRYPFGYSPLHGRGVTVPAGFVTDFASIPRLFWRVIGPPVGAGPGAAYGKAAVLHDFLYFSPGHRSRKTCDALFYEAMSDFGGVTPGRQYAMWAAVRVFGAIPWRRYRKKARAGELHRNRQ